MKTGPVGAAKLAVVMVPPHFNDELKVIAARAMRSHLAPRARINVYDDTLREKRYLEMRNERFRSLISLIFR
jgi:hypothetical protein